MSNKPFIHYYETSDGITAFSTTRHGGKSVGNYASFNINEYCDDEPEAISANREALAAELGIDSDKIIAPHQVHGIEVRNISSDFFALPKEVRKMVTEGVDAVMTNETGVCVGVSTADCIPVLLHDEAHHAVAAVHAGWRGTVQRAVLRTIAEMRAAYSTDPSQLKAIIGPGISVKNFEVGQEVFDQFSQAGFDMQAIAEFHEKWHINLPECNRQQLESIGVKPNNIAMSGICTFDNAADYFSARRIGTASGRIYTGIMIK